MKKTMIMMVAALLSFGFVIPVSAECDKKDCGKKQCKRKGKHGKKMFKFIDKNKDKKISKAEWTAHFNAIDANKDGSLTPKEIKKYHKKHK